jgi:hypothetical protein
VRAWHFSHRLEIAQSRKFRCVAKSQRSRVQMNKLNNKIMCSSLLFCIWPLHYNIVHFLSFKTRHRIYFHPPQISNAPFCFNFKPFKTWVDLFAQCRASQWFRYKCIRSSFHTFCRRYRLVARSIKQCVTRCIRRPCYYLGNGQSTSPIVPTSVFVVCILRHPSPASHVSTICQPGDYLTVH